MHNGNAEFAGVRSGNIGKSSACKALLTEVFLNINKQITSRDVHSVCVQQIEKQQLTCPI